MVPRTGTGALVGEQNIRRFCRLYIMDQLRKHGCHHIVEQLSLEYREPEDESYQLLHQIANQLADERQQQFEDVLYALQLTNENLKVTYDTVVTEIFRDGIHWGRVIAFLVFSSSLAVFCAQHGMESRVNEVIEWTESEMETRLQRWILERGGWQAFMEHFDDTSLNLGTSQGLLVAGVAAAAVIAGGVFLLRKLF